MRKLTAYGLLVAAGVGVGVMMATQTAAAPAKEPMVAHMVYFKLKESTPENRAKLVAACKKYLADHDGVVFFSAGVVAADFKRDVNDRDWDVGLHVVFKTKADHDHYQDKSERHQTFIAAGKELWAKVRVFDALIEPR